MSNFDAEDFDDFLKKVDEVEKQLKGLTSGDLKPEDVKFPGNSWAYDAAIGKDHESNGSTARPGNAPTPATVKPAATPVAGSIEAVNATLAPFGIKSSEEEEAERARARALQAKWDRERVERLAKEERDKWWTFAKLQYGDEGMNPPPPLAGATSTTFRKARGKDAIDYSWWDKWVDSPDDPVSVADRLSEAADKQKAQDDAFEKANPDFAAMVKGDIDKRQVAEQKKSAKAESLKLRGNEAFKVKDYRNALAAYHDAMKVLPFNPAVLNNIAACHLALNDFDGVIEYTSRVVFIEKYGPGSVIKALFRRAHAYAQRGALESAAADLSIAAQHDPANADVAVELQRVKLELAENRKELSAAAGAARDPTAAEPVAAPSSGATVGGADDDVSLAARIKRAAAAAAGADAHGRDKHAASAKALREIASDVSNDNDAVLVRSSGLLDGLCKHVCMAASRILDAAVAGTGAGRPAVSDQNSFFADIDSLAGAALLLSAVVFNAKNRLVVRTSGALDACADLLCVRDDRLEAAVCKVWGKQPSGDVTTSKPIQALLSALVSLVDVYIRPKGDAEARTFAASHVFVAGWWRASSVQLDAAASAPPAASAASAASSRCGAGLAALATADRAAVVDCIARIRAACSHLLTQLEVSDLYLEVVSGCVSVFQFIAPTDASLPAPAKGQADTNAKHISALQRQLASYSGAPSEQNPVTVLLQLATVLIGRSIIDEGLLTSYLMQGTSAALANLAAVESLRPAFTLQAVPIDAAAVSGNADASVAAGSNTSKKVKENAKQARANATKKIAPKSATVPSAAAAPSRSPPQEVKVAALHPLLDLQRIPVRTSEAWENVRASSLGALANACVGNDAAIKALVAAGAADVLLGMLDDASPAEVGGSDGGGGSSGAARAAAEAAAARSLPPVQPAMAPEVRSRAALLLGRVSGAAGTEQLMDPAVVGRVATWLKESISGSATAAAATTAGAADATAQYQDGLVRLLAASSTNPEALTSFVDTDGISTLVSFCATALPSLKPASGTPGHGASRSRAAAVGNACKLFIGLAAGAAAVGSTASARHQALLKAGACEVLIDALKAAGDDNVPVRKNAAVAVARLTAHPACKERITELRGMEILMQVSKQLL